MSRKCFFVKLTLLSKQKNNLLIYTFLFILFLSLALEGCHSAPSLPVKYLALKDNFDEQTLYNFFSSQATLKEAKEFFSVKEASNQKLKARERLIKLAPAGERERIKKVFNQFKATYPPSIPILIAKGKFKGENALILVEIWSSEKEKNFRWVRIWVFQEKNLRLLYALSFKNPF